MWVHIHMYAHACGGPRLALGVALHLTLSAEVAGPASLTRQLTAGSILSVLILPFQGDSHAYWALAWAIRI